MIVRLMWCIEPANKVTKAYQLVDELQGTLRYPCSILDPVITIERQVPTGFNYVQIVDFNRFYFVRNIVTETANTIVVSMHVDVLMSFNHQIRQCNAIIRRQENQFNLLLDDGIFKAYQDTRHKVIRFPRSMDSFSYVLAIAGNSEPDSSG